MFFRREINKKLEAIAGLLSRLPTRADLIQMEHRIMSAIAQFAEKQAAHNAKIDTAIDGIATDIAALNAKIDELQNSPGVITTEDQATLDALEAKGAALEAKVTALDDLTPPKPPTP